MLVSRLVLVSRWASRTWVLVATDPVARMATGRIWNVREKRGDHASTPPLYGTKPEWDGFLVNDDINSSVGEGDEVSESGGTSGLGELQQLGFWVSGSISKSVDEVYEAMAGAWRTAAGGLLQVGRERRRAASFADGAASRWRPGRASGTSACASHLTTCR